jgi:hypothetical protein
MLPWSNCLVTRYPGLPIFTAQQQQQYTNKKRTSKYVSCLVVQVVHFQSLSERPRLPVYFLYLSSLERPSSGEQVHLASLLLHVLLFLPSSADGAYPKQGGRCKFNMETCSHCSYFMSVLTLTCSHVLMNGLHGTAHDISRPAENRCA